MRQCLGLVLVLLLTLGVGCVPAAPATPPTAAPAVLTLRLGTTTTPPPALPESTLWLARDLGFYAREGLNVEITEAQATPSVVAALRSGEVDIGDINTEDVIRLTATRDLELRTINSSNGRNFFMIVGRRGIGSPSELSGKTFAIARPGSQDHALSSKVLAAKGLPADAVSYVAAGQPNVRAQALVAGQVDATTLSLATWITVQNDPNLHVLVSVDDYFDALPLVNKGNAVTLRVLNEKTEALRRFTAALIKASRYFAENKAGWVDAMARLRPDMQRADLEFLWDQFGASWAVNGQLNLGEYQKSTDFLYDNGAFEGAPRIGAAEWADPQFVDSVLKSIGVYPKVDDPGRAI